MPSKITDYLMDSDDLLEQVDDVAGPTAAVDDDERDDTDDLLEESDQLLNLSAQIDKTTTKATTKRTKAASPPAPPKPAPVKAPVRKGKGKNQTVYYDHARTKELANAYPDTYWQFHADAGHGMINAIHQDAPLQELPQRLSDHGAVTGMTLSDDGALLATFSSHGSVKVWHAAGDLQLVTRLRDTEETHIDEFYCGIFMPDAPHLIAVGGKLKDRHRWSADDNDNHIMPCPIKIFNLRTGTVVAKLEGHEEEVLCLKAVHFDGGNYLVSTSQDGHILKWHMDKDWTTVLNQTRMQDNLTYMAFTVAFVPNTGNKYILAACDEHIRVYDFEENRLVQTFEDIYSSYCDCGKFIEWLDEPQYWHKKGKEQPENEQYAWFITRGAEMCDDNGVASTPNTCCLHRLVIPKTANKPFVLEEVHRYKHEEYHANSWLVKIASNGRYLVAPTIYGQLFVFNLLTGKATGVIKSHENIEVRDVLFHPYRPLLFSCGDDGNIKVYTYKDDDDVDMVDAKDAMQQDLKVGGKS
ncbi:WD40-repeat-containing domain protein [Gongronella butleri]|nr:WD40-repeat-containing domain protein [Gongronella butleri]